MTGEHAASTCLLRYAASPGMRHQVPERIILVIHLCEDAAWRAAAQKAARQHGYVAGTATGSPAGLVRRHRLVGEVGAAGVQAAAQLGDLVAVQGGEHPLFKRGDLVPVV